jgi:two-component system NtrC family response regulator
VTIVLPPLCERPEDIPELVEHFLTTRRIGPRRFHIEPDALNALRRHAWPGNVRELANVLERAQILADGETITLDELPDTFQDAPDTTQADSTHLHAVERRHVVELLRQHKGNKVHAARALGVSRRALYRLISKYHLDAEESTRPT